MKEKEKRNLINLIYYLLKSFLLSFFVCSSENLGKDFRLFFLFLKRENSWFLFFCVLNGNQFFC